MPLSRLLFCVLLVPPLTATAAERAPRAVTATELPVRAVTVFSDQARVIRTGELRLDATVRRLEFPRLPQSVLPDSIRVESTGARIAHVEVHPVRLGELPKTEAENLIERLTHLRDEANALQDQLATVTDERSFLASIRPKADPVTRESAPPLLLNPAGWAASSSFLRQRETDLITRQGELAEGIQVKKEEIARTEELARQLLGAAGEGPGFIVSAAIDGREGTSKITLSYLARGARWYPSYDVHYVPGKKEVGIGFAGLVSQETGEDWSDARLTLSTAIPATVTNLPQLAVWKIGDRERFIPTPHAGPQDGPAPSRNYRATPQRSPAEESDLRERLSAMLDGEGEMPPPPPPTPMPSPPRSAGQRRKAEARLQGAEYSRSMAPAAPPPPRDIMADGRGFQMEYDSEEVADSRVSATAVGESASASSASRTPRAYVSFASPQGWRQPPLPGDLPASLAGGYDFSYDSARPESIRSGAEARRVPLFTGTHPAESWIKVLPALSHSAYLVAEVKNAGTTPWLKGQAHLFVGSDLVGDATVPTTAPGEKVTLPLGIDDAIRVERNVQTVASERGLFAKQDVGAYETTIELLNTRSTAVPVRVSDQIPLARQPEVVVTLDKTEPAPFKADRELKEDGTLEWRLNLAAGTKQTIKFRYEVVRPKNWRLWQTSTPGVSR